VTIRGFCGGGLVKSGKFNRFSSKKYLFREVLSEKAEHFVLFPPKLSYPLRKSCNFFFNLSKKYEKVAISSEILVKSMKKWQFFLKS